MYLLCETIEPHSEEKLIFETTEELIEHLKKETEVSPYNNYSAYKISEIIAIDEQDQFDIIGRL